MTTSVWPCVNVSAQGVPPRDPDSEASPCLRADRGHMRMSIRPTPQCDSRSCPEVPLWEVPPDRYRQTRLCLRISRQLPK
jgi:hypothetical protein